MHKTINGWTKEKMIAHIKAEFKGKSENGAICLYRGPEGKKCAVGMFIPEDLYRKNMDTENGNGGIGAKWIIEKFKLQDIMPLDNLGMGCLQFCHDQSIPSETLSDIIRWIDTNVEANNS